jgi:ABC-type polysaccharide/polyol phosphate export permease
VRSLPWAFVVSAIRFGTLSLIGNGNLISKIYFPKEVFPIAAVITALFDFSVAAAAMTVLLIFLGVGVSVYLAWVPVLLFILFVLVCGLVFIFSAAGLFFRDVKYLVEAGLTFGIFFTPVFFSAATFGKIGNYMLLNPVAPILEAMDAVVIGQHGPDLAWVGYSAAFAVLSLLLGFKFFKNLEPAFAENI